MTVPAVEPTRSWPRREGRRFLEVLALCGFAVAQPVLDVFGRAPSELVFRQASTGDALAFVAIVVLVPPVALWAAGALVGLAGSRARRIAHLATLGALLVVLGLQVVKKVTPVRGPLLVAVASVVAAGLLVLYLRAVPVRTWFAYAAPAPLVFALLFLLASPAADVVWASGADVDPVEATGNGAPVVVMVFDEFPLASIVGDDGGIDAELFPNLAALAGDGTFYRNATTVAGGTWFAVPSILTGRYPEPETMPVVTDHPESLFTLLGGSYHVDAAEALTRMCPASVCEAGGTGESDVTAVTSVGLGALLEDARGVWRAVTSTGDTPRDPTASFVEEAIGAGVDAAPGEEVSPDFDAVFANQPARYRGFLDGLGSGERPSLDYLHILLPHSPWRYLPSGLEYPVPDPTPGSDGTVWTDEEWPVTVARQRHLLQVRYLDGLVGEVVERLRSAGMYDDAVVVVTADHGVAFQPGEPMRGTFEDEPLDEIYPENVWVPLVVKVPGQGGAGTVSDANVETVDILPTIADLVGIELPWEVDGRSLVSDPPRTGSAKTFYPSFITVYGNFLEEEMTIDGDVGQRLVTERSVGALTVDDDPEMKLYRIGPYGELVGRPVRELAVGPAAGVRGHVDGGASRTFDPATGTAPVHVLGRLDGRSEATVAVAVDGVVAGVSPTFTWEDREGTFVMMIPEPLLTPGTIELDLYLLEDRGGSVELRPVPLEG